MKFREALGRGLGETLAGLVFLAGAAVVYLAVAGFKEGFKKVKTLAKKRKEERYADATPNKE